MDFTPWPPRLWSGLFAATRTGERFTSVAIAIVAPGAWIEWADFPLDRVGF